MSFVTVTGTERPARILWRFVKRKSPFVTGDALLVKTRTVIGRTIARIEGNGEFSHGVVFNTSTQVASVDEHGCRLLDPWAEGYEGVVLRLLEPLATWEVRAGQKWLHTQIGKPYPFVQLPVLYVLYKLDWLFPGIRRDAVIFSKSRVCIAFVCEFLKRCGRDVVPGVHETVEAFQDLLDSPQLGRYCTFPPPPDFDPTAPWKPLRIAGPLKIVRRRRRASHSVRATT